MRFLPPSALPRSVSLRAVLPQAVALLAGLSLFAAAAGAGLHLEPYLGYGLTVTNPQPAGKADGAKNAVHYFLNSKYYHGPSAGARIGYKSFGLSVGLDAAVGSWQALYDRESLTPFLAGLFVSYRLPMLFRIYAVFLPGLLAPTAFVNVAGPEADKLSSSCRAMGGKLGVSYFSMPFLSVNLEYMPLYIKGRNCLAWSHTGTAYLNFLF